MLKGNKMAYNYFKQQFKKERQERRAQTDDYFEEQTSQDKIFEIEKLNDNFEGIAHKKGKMFVIKDALPGEKVEIKNIKKEVHPTEILLVVDSMTGQDAVETARAFNERLNFDGVVLTKLDGDTRGGAALSIRAVVNKPIKFISAGEKMEALDVFHPKRIADRILGMGDVVTLVEKAQEQFDEEEAKKLQKKLIKDQFTLSDFYDQIQQIKKMGNIKDLASMLPGVGKALRDVDIDNSAFKSVEAIIQSMTPYERENPHVINGSRRRRIAEGSGTTIVEVNRLLKQFEDTRKVMKMMAGGGIKGKAMNAMKAMKGMRR